MKKRNRNTYRIVLSTLLLSLGLYLTLPHRLGRTQETEMQQPESPEAVFTVTTNLDSGAGSFRQAVIDANASAGLDTIQFAVGTGPVEINNATALPDITQPVIIDGTTQPGFGGTPLIRFTGTNGGLKITGGGSTVRAIAVVNTNLGITLENAGGNIIAGSFIGICPQSVVFPCGNNANGILINNSPNNQIGGTTIAERNNIGNNISNGIRITGSAASGNIIIGNLIGLLADATIRRNRETGVRIDGAPNNRVGGTTAGERNVISTNGLQLLSNLTESGVLITGAGASGNVVQGNYIGTTMDGTDFGLGAQNTWNGVRIEGAANNTIGGTVGTTPGGACTGACNLIATFAGNGIRTGVTITGSGATGNSVLGNYIGTNLAGTAALNNNISVIITAGASNNTVGGTTASGRNLINNGIRLTAGAATNTIQGNYIGTDTSGNTSISFMASGFAAVTIDNSSNNQIGTAAGTTLGGACTGGCNVISGNLFGGVGITGAASTGNRVDYNYIGLNAAGTTALRNGNLGAIRLLNGANGNTIGRPPGYSYQSTTPAPPTTYLIQNKQTGSFIQYDTTTRQYTVKDCRGNIIVGGTVSPENVVPNGTTITFSDSVFLVESGFSIEASFDTVSGKGEGSLRQFSKITPTLVTNFGDDIISNHFGDCPTPSMLTIVSGVTNAANNNTFNFISVGTDRTGRVNLSAPQDGNVFNASGNFNVYSNLYIATNGGNFPALEIGAGTDDFITGLNVTALNAGQYVNRPIVLGPGANRNLLPPGFVAVRRDLDGEAFVSGTVTGPPNTRILVSLQGVSQHPSDDQVSDVYDLNLSFEVMTNAAGTMTFNRSFIGPDAKHLFHAYGVLATATVINQVPIASENSTITFVDVPGDTSEMSALAVVPQPRFDRDSDGKTDFIVYRPGATANEFSFWYVLNSSNFTFQQVQFGNGEDKPVAGDYQGDGVMDFAVFRPSNGTWYHSRLTGNPSTNFVGIQWGTSIDIPVPGDYDGDGANDAAIFRPSNGTWWIRRSLGDTFYVQQWGLATDKVAPADYDGDGDTDIAVFRPSNGTWYISPCPGCTPRYAQFGLAGDVPTPGDYDGDGADDIAVWRPSTGIWYLLRSTAGFGAVQFGLSTDKPLNGDFDADGKNDIAIWRPSTGDWWILKSSDANLILVHWGQNGDIPATAFAGAP